MKAVDHLHPALTHHIVNSLGWGTLRPLQEESIEPILAGKHALLLAPTAAGKTEAAFFPVLSRMLSENWSGMSVLYICPLKALLNSLHTRLEQYCKLVGRSCGVWHGDISASVKGRILEEPPDCLLTTPESLEVLLISNRIDKRALFGDVRVVVVDEIHSFAGDDRGWHLASVLERLTKLSDREMQRVGLSATVGNATDLLQWLSGHCVGEGTVINPPTTDSKQPEVQLDYVGTLSNAALVISRLHRGQKRLVFCDSRSRVEELTSHLRALGVETFVSHSSLSADERRRAEAAFQMGTDCVIVATSTLELGIDVGDLDRVIQIDAPTTVASFLQRMGRTGRRSDSQRNCLFLATSSDALIRAAGIIHLWREGFVEAVVPPLRPLHVFAQQIMALAIQQGGIGFQSWRHWLGRVPAFDVMAEGEAEQILSYMTEKGILSHDQGTLWLGQQGEQKFGWRNFMELFSVFNSPPMFKVRHGQTELGEVHEYTFFIGNQETIRLLLGGKSWEVTHIDWKKRVAYVQPVTELGKSRWPGDGAPLSFRLCRAIRDVLASEGEPDSWSRRARDRIGEMREEFNWVESAKTVALSSSTGKFSWWTFGGKRANAAIAERLRQVTALPFTFTNLSVELNGPVQYQAFSDAIKSLRLDPPWRNPQSNMTKAIHNLKFSVCVPPRLAEEMLQMRLADKEGVMAILSEEIKQVTNVIEGGPAFYFDSLGRVQCPKNPAMYLSKTDFKIARTCGTKLYYRKLGFPTTQDDDPYLEFLADGGYMVEAIAKLLFPEGREIVVGPGQDEFAATMEALGQEEVTLFEATLCHSQLRARVDILEKRGNNFRLIEVKAKSVDFQENLLSPFRGTKGRISTKWIPYLEDVTFQTHILRSLFPDAQLTPCLCVVDKSKTSNAETIFENFRIVPRSKDLEGIFQKPQVTFTGDVATLVDQSFVRVFDVTPEVEELLPEVERAATAFAATLTGDMPIRIEPNLGLVCKKCEYRVEASDRNGFRECWGKLADPSPHLLDLYRVDRLGKEVITNMIAEGKCGLGDISLNELQGIIGERQIIQLEGTLNNNEFINPELPTTLANCKYPLHFVDFEASRIAVPYHAGMHPYEQVAFQWSCHSIPKPGADLVHREWINVDEAYPNIKFARSLKEVITGEGTVFVWSSFERSALDDVRSQLGKYANGDVSLSDWLDLMVDDAPIVDLHQLAKKYYFHPDMRGSLSIKDVLPAVWLHNAALRSHPWFAEYLKEKDGRILNPYETLEPLPFGDNHDEQEEEAVREGTGAIRTYQEMMYGLQRSDPSFRKAKKQLLLNYCKLDTAAMVMIWMHWTGRAE